MATAEQLQLLAVCALHDGPDRVDWSLVAREAMRDGGLDALLDGQIHERSKAADKALPILRRLLSELPAALARVQSEVAVAAEVGARLVTVLDDDYPRNLTLVPNLPPFLFIRGQHLVDADLRSVAVVGTRRPSPEGRRRARAMATELVATGATVVSGLAAGIDTAAHRATLDAGGRTIAVVGTGISRTYPADNVELAEAIAEQGLLVSQFWPSTPPAKWTFPRRNVVMSGIAQGTVVIEASGTSGARMQARLAIEHGKLAFLMADVVRDQEWAHSYVDQGKAIEVDDVDDVLQRLATPERIRSLTDQRQLTLNLV